MRAPPKNIVPHLLQGPSPLTNRVHYSDSRDQAVDPLLLRSQIAHLALSSCGAASLPLRRSAPNGRLKASNISTYSN